MKMTTLEDYTKRPVCVSMAVRNDKLLRCYNFYICLQTHVDRCNLRGALTQDWDNFGAYKSHDFLVLHWWFRLQSDF